MHDGRVVAPAELAADLGQRARGQLLGQIHRHLPGPGHRAGAPGGMHVGNAHVEVLGDAFLDLLDRDAALIRPQEVAEHLLGAFQRDRLADQGGVGDDAGERPLELTDVRGNPAG